MHKEWVKVEGGYGDVDRTKPWRYLEEYAGEESGGDGYSPVEYGYQQEVDVRDATDEPDVDGIYVDKDGDRWVRINSFWFSRDEFLADAATWDEDWAEYGPFELLDPSDY